MRNNMLSLLDALGIPVWHRQAVVTESSPPLKLLILAPAISDFMLHQRLFRQILSALGLQDDEWQVIHRPELLAQQAAFQHLWLLGEVNLPQQQSAPASTIHSPQLQELADNREAKRKLWQQLKPITQ